jgi:hypothetical protein
MHGNDSLKAKTGILAESPAPVKLVMISREKKAC